MTLHEGPRSLHDTIAGVRGEGEVGVQRDYGGSVHGSHRVTDLHLRVESGLVGVGSEQGHAGFLGSNGQLLAICPPHQ